MVHHFGGNLNRLETLGKFSLSFGQRVGVLEVESQIEMVKN